MGHVNLNSIFFVASLPNIELYLAIYDLPYINVTLYQFNKSWIQNVPKISEGKSRTINARLIRILFVYHLFGRLPGINIFLRLGSTLWTA